MGQAGHVDGISRSRGWDKEIEHCVLPMEQLVLGDKRARKSYLKNRTSVWERLKKNPNSRTSAARWPHVDP